MDELKKALSPLTDTLPPGVRDALDAGGWWVVLGVAGLAAVLLGWALANRLLRALFGRGHVAAEQADRALHENLADYPPPLPPTGDRRLAFYHLAARLRLVVVAPLGTETDLDAAAVGKLLDRVVPRLRKIAALDGARVRLWPPQLSQQGFAPAFRRRTRRPEPEGELSHWVLVTGRAQAGRQVVMLGLGLWTEELTALGQVNLDLHQWLDVLRIRTEED
jgi:hypothetical protein